MFIADREVCTVAALFGLRRQDNRDIQGFCWWNVMAQRALFFVLTNLWALTQETRMRDRHYNIHCCLLVPCCPSFTLNTLVVHPHPCLCGCLGQARILIFCPTRRSLHDSLDVRTSTRCSPCVSFVRALDVFIMNSRVPSASIDECLH